MSLLARVAALMLVLAGASGARAAEFLALQEPAVLYDAPSSESTKRFVLGAGYPLMVLVKLATWTKVRDASGDFGWVESRTLGKASAVLVSAPVADVRARAAADAPLVFQAEKDVLLEVIDPPADGWVHVRHRDGATGYVSAAQVWGQ